MTISSQKLSLNKLNNPNTSQKHNNTIQPSNSNLNNTGSMTDFPASDFNKKQIFATLSSRNLLQV